MPYVRVNLYWGGYETVNSRDPRMGMKRRFGTHIYALVAVTSSKNDLMTFAKNQRKVGGRVRVTKDNYGHGTEYTAWHGGYR